MVPNNCKNWTLVILDNCKNWKPMVSNSLATGKKSNMKIK